MTNYIEVVRHFVKLGPELDEYPAWFPRKGDRLTWKHVLGNDHNEPVVLLAPSGYGKSTEVLQQARRLRSEGCYAITSTAVALATDGLRDGLDPENRNFLDDWRKTSNPAALFIDAVDELALQQKTLRDMLRKLEAGVSVGQRSVKLVLTARTGMCGLPPKKWTVVYAAKRASNASSRCTGD